MIFSLQGQVIISLSKSDSSPITLELSDSRSIHLTAGISYTVQCDVTSEVFSDPPWVYNGSPVSTDTSDSVHYITPAGSQRRNLIFRNFTSSQSGSYSCRTNKLSKTLLISEGTARK